MMQVEDRQQLLSTTERTESILAMRLGGKTLQEIGNKYNVSRERIRQIEKMALGGMSKQSKDKYLGAVHAPSVSSMERERSRARSKARKALVEWFESIPRSITAHRATTISGIDLGLNGEMSEVDICAAIHAKFHISWFGKYARCGDCSTVKLCGEFAPSIAKGERPPNRCRECGAKHQSWLYHNNESYRQKCKEWVNKNPDKVRRYAKRYHAKKRAKAR